MTNLKDLYIFEGFENNFLEKIISSTERKFFKAGDIVLKEGNISKDAYILVKGIVSISIKGKNINTIFEGDIFGEIGLVMDEPRTASVKAETDIELLVINKRLFSEILKRFPDGDYIKNTILNRIIQNNKKLR